MIQPKAVYQTPLWRTDGMVFLTVVLGCIVRQYKKGVSKMNIYIGVFLAYIFLHMLTTLAVVPIQQAIPFVGEYGAILYIPSSIRVLSIWLLGFKGLIAIIAATFLCTFADIDGAITWKYAILSIGSPLAVFAAFSFIDQFENKPKNWAPAFADWKKITYVCALSGLLNGLFFSVMFHSDLVTSATVFIGDLLGLWTGYLFLVLFRRVHRFTRHHRL